MTKLYNPVPPRASLHKKHGYQDPLTGDTLTLGERVSWILQGIIRRWTFLITITLITAVVWIINNPTGLIWWNLSASYLALVIESIVGLAMFNQTRRDAVFIRHIDAMGKAQETITAHLEKLDENILEILQHQEKTV